MKTVLKMPDNAIPHLQAQIGKNRKKQRIKRDNGPVINVVTDLPTNAAAITQGAHAFSNHLLLLSEVIVQVKMAFVFLPQVVRREVTTN